jgi:hypothetical protein
LFLNGTIVVHTVFHLYHRPFSRFRIFPDGRRLLHKMSCENMKISTARIEKLRRIEGPAARK